MTHGRRISVLYRMMAMMLLNTLLLLIGLELAAGAVLTIATFPTVKGLLAQVTGKPNDLVSHYRALPYYAEQDWSSRYWQEHQLALKKSYYPYVIWRSPAFTGTMLNIDQDGIRQTPGAECSPDAYKLFIFGGSAIWGWGAPDWGTIPAYLQAELQAREDRPVCVINFGENAYISTQSRIQLELMLETGNVPDAVIFYDGVNEVLAASQTGQPILHQNYAEIMNRFQNPQPPLISWFQSLNSVQLLQQVMLQTGVSGNKGNAHHPVDTDQLAKAIAQAYLNHCKIVSALAETYEFDAYFFWQPYILIGDKPLTNEEQSMMTELDWVLVMDPELIALFTATYKRIESAAPTHQNLYYIAPVFDGVESQLWIDTWGHVTPEGNRLIAQKMLPIIEKQLAEK